MEQVIQIDAQQDSSAEKGISKITDLKKARAYFGDFMSECNDNEVLTYYYACLHLVKKLIEVSNNQRKQNIRKRLE